MSDQPKEPGCIVSCLGGLLGIGIGVFILGAIFWPYHVVEEEQVKKTRNYPFRNDPVDVLDTNNRSYGYYFNPTSGEPWPLDFRGLTPGVTIKVNRYRNLYGYGIGFSAEPILPEQNVPSWWWDRKKEKKDE
jgi:hypothetical protein